jgi:hypothetical protein
MFLPCKRLEPFIYRVHSTQTASLLTHLFTDCWTCWPNAITGQWSIVNQQEDCYQLVKWHDVDYHLDLSEWSHKNSRLGVLWVFINRCVLVHYPNMTIPFSISKLRAIYSIRVNIGLYIILTHFYISVITTSLIFIFILYCKPRGDNVKLWIALIIWAVSFIKFHTNKSLEVSSAVLGSRKKNLNFQISLF